jgi:hypothetical protein
MLVFYDQHTRYNTHTNDVYKKQGEDEEKYARGIPDDDNNDDKCPVPYFVTGEVLTFACLALR